MEGIEKGYLEEVDKAAKCYLEALTGNNGVEWAEEDVGRLNAMSAAMLRDRGFNVRYPDSGTGQPEMVVLERSNGFYGGYERTKGGYVQMFNTKTNLFASIQKCIERGYRLTLLDQSYEEAFMKDRRIASKGE